jgi:predicted ATPase
VDEAQLERTDVPSTLTGVLQARLERLPKVERTLIQQASVVGRVFWDQAVWYLNHQGGGALEKGGIQDGLLNLRDRELIYRRELSAFLDSREYIFKHAVLREVTYESVLKKLRQVYHSLTAEWLMEQRGDRSGEVVGLIADHLELAGEQDEALRYLKWAGEAAAEKYANEEAVDYFSRALALAPGEDLETRYELLLAREEVLDLQATREAQRQDLEKLNSLANEMGSTEQQMEVGVRWSNYLFFTADYVAAADVAERVVAQAKVTGNPHYAAKGHLRLGRALHWQSQLEIARGHFEQALAGFRSVGDQRNEGLTLRMFGLISVGQGDLQSWQDYSKQALDIARKIGIRDDEAEAINHLGLGSLFLGDFTTAQKYFNQYLTLSQEIGSKLQEGYAFGNMGWLAIDMKNYLVAKDYFELSLTILQDREENGEILAGLGDAFAGLKKWDEATKSYLGAIKVFEEFDADWGIAGSRTGLARVALAQGDVKGALGFVDKVLIFLEQSEATVHDEILRSSYLTCVQVLQAAKDPRTSNVLEIANNNIQKTAKKIKDEALQYSFLENVPWNRELVKLWEEQRAKLGRAHDSI